MMFFVRGGGCSGGRLGAGGGGSVGGGCGLPSLLFRISHPNLSIPLTVLCSAMVVVEICDSDSGLI